MDAAQVIFMLAGIFALIIITRLFGAWMLRINELIALNKEQNRELKALREAIGEYLKKP